MTCDVYLGTSSVVFIKKLASKQQCDPRLLEQMTCVLENIWQKRVLLGASTIITSAPSTNNKKTEIPLTDQVNP